MSLSDWVVVFDLDDTLISEHEYQKSGISAVEKYISSLYDVSFEKQIHLANDAGILDLWGWACEQLKLPLDIKESFLWIYRLHEPNIRLSEGVKCLLASLKCLGAQLVVLSDGRSITQRLKLRAVNLEEIPAFISEDFQSTKPDPLRFIAIENTWVNRKYVYIADNPEKDFLAPRSRNWLTIGALWVSPRVHPLLNIVGPTNVLPQYWAKSPSEVLHLLQSF